MDGARAQTIEINNLSVRLGGKSIIDDLSLSLSPGEKVALTGPSGSGKSTVLRCVLGFVQPSAGTIRIDGRPLTSDSIWEVRTRLAYVGQEPELGRGRVRELLDQAFTYHANTHLKRNRARAPELLERFLLSPRILEEEITTLSGGEKQRVAIVAAILLDRRLFLLDEASSALDKESRQAVVDFFRAGDDLTVLSVAHDLDGFAVADRTVALPAGAGASKQRQE